MKIRRRSWALDFVIRLNYDIHAPRHTPSTSAPLSLPPNREESFRPRPQGTLDRDDTLYRWAGGEVTEFIEPEEVTQYISSRLRHLRDSSTLGWHAPLTPVLADSNLTVKTKRGLQGVVNGQRIAAVADTGACQNIVSESYARYRSSI